MTNDVRASDAEREQVAEALRTHAAAGRLDAEELDERMGRALAARTRAELEPLVADLPEPAPQRPRPRRELPRIAPVIPLAILLVAIWALTGAGYFWPIWPIGALLIGAFKHSGAGCGRVIRAR
jgi:fatty acid desaturase